MTDKEIIFHKTHDLIYLFEKCSVIDHAFSQFRSEAELLTPLAVMYRYPGVLSSPGIELSQGALNAARKIYGYVCESLKETLQ